MLLSAGFIPMLMILAGRIENKSSAIVLMKFTNASLYGLVLVICKKIFCLRLSMSYGE